MCFPYKKQFLKQRKVPKLMAQIQTMYAPTHNSMADYNPAYKISIVSFWLWRLCKN